MLFNCTNILHADEYLHYFNVRSLFKKAVDKKYQLTTNNAARTTLRININEFESVKYVYFAAEPQLKDPRLIFNKIIIQKFIADLDVKQKTLIHGTGLFLNS